MPGRKFILRVLPAIFLMNFSNHVIDGMKLRILEMVDRHAGKVMIQMLKAHVLNPPPKKYKNLVDPVKTG